MTLRTASDSLNRRVIGLALLLGLIMQLFVLAGSASAITAEDDVTIRALKAAPGRCQNSCALFGLPESVD